MERIKGQLADEEELAKQVLSWIVCAIKPLTTYELEHALAVEAREPQLDTENLCRVEDMVSVCAGLVTVDEESSIVRLVHYMTQEYFERTQSYWFPNAETHITEICVTYLSFNVFEHGFCQTDREFEERLQSNQFFEYAAQNWGHHACKASTISQAVVEFLESETKIDAASQGLFACQRYSFHYSQHVPTRITGLNLAAYFGAEAVVQLLLDQGAELEAKDSNGRTPLSRAAENGHEAVVKLLLDKAGIDPNSKDTRNGWTPLWWAVKHKHLETVKLLLDKEGIDPNSKDTRNGWTPLSWAAAGGYEEIVKLLLDKEGVNPDSKDTQDGRTPLSWAAARGYEEIVKLLLDKEGVNPDSMDYRGWTPLWWAAKSGHNAAITLLRSKGSLSPIPTRTILKRRYAISNPSFNFP